jgi:hypothetical protein
VRRRALGFWLVLAMLVAFLVGTTRRAIEAQSPTPDELTHLVRGLSILWTGDTRLSYAHPPLANVVAALPGALTMERCDFSTLDGWSEGRVNRITRAFAARGYPAARRAWQRGRVAMLVFPIALLVYLAWFCRARFGPWVGLLAPALVATHPSFLAHASLTTTDAPAACLIAIATCELVRLVERRSLARTLSFSAALGLAVVTKFSALFLAPLACVVLVVAAIATEPHRALGQRLGRCAAMLALVIGSVTLVVNGAYLFQSSGWTVGHILHAPEPINPISASSHGELLEESPVGYLPRRLVVPLPYTYVFGVFTIEKQTTGGHPAAAYFMGELRREGFYSYFPVLLVAKSPIGFSMALLVAAAVLARAWARRHRVGSERRALPFSRELAIVGAVGGVYLAMAIASRLNIGVRHALPLLPLLAIGVTAGVAWLARRGRTGALALGAAIVATQAGSAWMASPDLLGYFNGLVGGPAAERKLSVIGEDWGQDVRELGLLVRARKLEPLYYRGVGHTSARELALLGVEPKRLTCAPPTEPAWVALHESLHVRHADCFAWLPPSPELWIENHIGLYRVTPGSGAASERAGAKDDDDDDDDR